MTKKLLALALLAGTGQSYAQVESAAPTFEIASVRVSGPKSVRGSNGGPGTSDPGRYSYYSATLNDLIVIGYDVNYFQISSKVPLDRERFDLVANVPPGATKAQFRAMLRNLLAERFHLQAQTISKDFPAYELVVAKTGLKMKESTGNAAPSTSPTSPPVNGADGFPELPPNRFGLASHHTISGGHFLIRMRGQRASMSQVASSLNTPDDRPVVDKTGLTGIYDFTLEFTQEKRSLDPDGEPPIVPNLFKAIEQQLGLQLVEKKLPFTVVVVESVDRLPIEN